MLAAVEDPSQGSRGALRVGAPADSWLHACAAQANYSMTLEAAGRSSDINRPDADAGAAPLLNAMGHCNLDGALALIDAGANVLARDRDGLGVLHHAAFSGDEAMLNLALALAPEQLNERSAGQDAMLVALGQAPEEEDPDYDWGRRGGDRSFWSKPDRASPPSREQLFENEGLAPIHCAILGGNAEALSFLLGAGADPQVLSREGKSALALAASAGAAGLVKILLEGGCDCDELDASGRSALSWAVLSGKPECVQTLLEAGADLDARGPAPLSGWETMKKSGREAARTSPSESIKALVEAWTLKAALAPAAAAPKPLRV